MNFSVYLISNYELTFLHAVYLDFKENAFITSNYVKIKILIILHLDLFICFISHHLK